MAAISTLSSRLRFGVRAVLRRFGFLLRSLGSLGELVSINLARLRRLSLSSCAAQPFNRRYFVWRFDVLIGRRDARLPHRQDACATGKSRFSFSDFAIQCVNLFRWIGSLELRPNTAVFSAKKSRTSLPSFGRQRSKTTSFAKR